MQDYRVRVSDNGTKKWSILGEDGKTEYLHNEDGPAIVYPNGDKLYYRNGLLHNEKGAAIAYHDGERSYYLLGKLMTFEEWKVQSVSLDGQIRELEGKKYKLTLVG